MTKAYFVEKNILEKLNVNDSEIISLYENFSRIESNFTTQGQQFQKQRALKNLLTPYCIEELDKINNFKPIWMQYIKTGLFKV